MKSNPSSALAGGNSDGRDSVIGEGERYRLVRGDFLPLISSNGAASTGVTPETFESAEWKSVLTNEKVVCRDASTSKLFFHIPNIIQGKKIFHVCC